jgi:hypothetical protein
VKTKFTEMATIKAKTKTAINTGAIGLKDLENSGFQHLTFFINKNTIGVEVCGFCSSLVFYINPKNDLERRKNGNFLNRYILPCEDSDSLINELRITK